jgi:cytochrome P450
MRFDRVWAVEHHSLHRYAHMSAPETFLAWVGARTRRIRLGHGVVCIPFGYNHPARAAERAATLDALSGGRVDLGAGRGGTVQEMSMCGVDPEQTYAQVEEALRMIGAMWLEDTFEWESELITVKSPTGRPHRVIPRPVQWPHPPLHLACTKADTVALAAEYGVGALVMGFAGVDEVRHLREIYDTRITSRTGERFVSSIQNDHFTALCPTITLDDPDEALRIGARGQRFFAESIAYWYGGGPEPDDEVDPDEDVVAMIEKQRDAVIARLHEAKIPIGPQTRSTFNIDHAYGDAERAIAYVSRLQEAGADEIMCLMQMVTVPHEACMETHAEIVQVQRDWETFTATDGVEIHKVRYDHAAAMISAMDPPDHARLRRLVSAGFTPRMIDRLEDLITKRTDRILDTAASLGECDFVRDVAFPLPMHVIADIVGIPEADRRWVFEQVERVLRAYDTNTSLTPEDSEDAHAVLFAYAKQLSEAKRAHPQDDVWTLISHAEVVGDDGEPTRLAGLELEAFFVVLTLAGSETSRNAISQGLVALLQHPEQLEHVREDRGARRIATDEVLRWTSPVLFFGRTATRDVDLGGADVRAGDRVVVWYPSGNRDDRVFADPFRLDVRRSPNPHLSFGGGGIHYCLGANLARKEIDVMLGATLDRFDVEIVDEPTWLGVGAASNVGVGLDRLPVSLTPR